MHFCGRAHAKSFGRSPCQARKNVIWLRGAVAKRPHREANKDTPLSRILEKGVEEAELGYRIRKVMSGVYEPQPKALYALIFQV